MWHVFPRIYVVCMNAVGVDDVETGQLSRELSLELSSDKMSRNHMLTNHACVLFLAPHEAQNHQEMFWKP